MLLEHSHPWYNPFEVDGRTLKNIHFYTPDGIKFSSGHGWINKAGSSNSNNEWESGLVIPGDVVYKRTPIDFNKAKGIFLVKVKRAYYEKGPEKYSELYIPYVASEWTITEKRYSYNPEYIYVYNIYTHKDGYALEVHKENVPKTENIQFIKDISELLKLAGDDNPDTYDIIKNQDQIKALIQGLAEKYQGA